MFYLSVSPPQPTFIKYIWFNSNGEKTRTLFFDQQGSNRRYKIFKSSKYRIHFIVNEPNMFFILQNTSFSYCLSRPNSSPTSSKPTFYILWGQGSYLNKLCILFRQRKQLWLHTKEIWNDGKEGSKREEKRGREEEGRTREWKHMQDPALLELQSLWTPAEYFRAMSGY